MRTLIVVAITLTACGGDRLAQNPGATSSSSAPAQEVCHTLGGREIPMPAAAETGKPPFIFTKGPSHTWKPSNYSQANGSTYEVSLLRPWLRMTSYPGRTPAGVYVVIGVEIKNTGTKRGIGLLRSSMYPFIDDLERELGDGSDAGMNRLVSRDLGGVDVTGEYRIGGWDWYADLEPGASTRVFVIQSASCSIAAISLLWPVDGEGCTTPSCKRAFRLTLDRTDLVHWRQ